MPASEQTWRSTKTLHFVFGVSSLVLLFATIWMFVKDHQREWKPYQTTFRDAELRLTEWRKWQYTTDTVRAERERLESQLVELRAAPLDAGRMSAFRDAAASAGLDGPLNNVDARLTDLGERSQAAQTAWQELRELELAADKAQLKAEDARKKAAELAASGGEQADEAQRSADQFAADADVAKAQLDEKRQKAESLSQAAATVRGAIVADLDAVIKRAKFNEDEALKARKGKNAALDKAKADHGMGIRDQAPEAGTRMTDVDEEIASLQAQVLDLTMAYERAGALRRQLRQLRSELTADEDAGAKRLDEALSAEKQLERAYVERRSNFFTTFPVPGKRWLEMPILDAFHSPLKIENNWADGLEQNYNFRNVRRFDRCMTCHQAMEKTLPGSAVAPAFEPERRFEVALALPAEDEGDSAAVTPTSLASGDSNLSPAELAAQRVVDAYGLHFAGEGLIERKDVTVAYVRPRSPGAAALIQVPAGPAEVLAEEITAGLMQPGQGHLEADPEPGLLVGDVIESVNGDRINDVERLVARLADAAQNNESLTLGVRRGLPHPYVTHPRLDLFVGSLSPHKVADFACTICHDGQGSATAFKWASHTPDSTEQQKEWAEQYGWFDNHHWIYPMQPQRFIESTCLKCHHDVTELEPSERFPEPPAPQLMRGYQVILKYGCFGCHEINGYDGARRIGPDLRVEPNVFAAAQQLQATPGFDQLAAEDQARARELVASPHLAEARHALLASLQREAKAEQPRVDPATLDKLIGLLKDVDAPGDLRKVGPSLRGIGAKSDGDFLYHWIMNPAGVRASTRMPRFFGLHNHLHATPESLEMAERLEPIEVEGMIAYLLSNSQPTDLLQPPEGITESTPEEQAERGKVLFEERGCLACHSHPDFPDVAKFRAADVIQQGPDLGGLGEKFASDRNPRGRAWLYSWIKEPTRYHPRTKMPNLFLDPITTKDQQGNVTSVTDPAADIVAYLLTNSGEWRATPRPSVNRDALRELVEMHLREALSESRAAEAALRGIPERDRAGLKGAEQDLVVADAEYDASSHTLKDEQLLRYVGRKTIAKFGCYACHDIPGFEEAKPIGTALNDWGRKESGKLAFEHIHEYLHGGHGHGGHGGDAAGTTEAAPEHAGHEHDAAGDGHEHADAQAPASQPLESLEGEYPPFYAAQLNAGNRIGFLYQKLREPRSYDYQKAQLKKYSEWLRMPLFPFDDEEREAVMTFVLGLVAEPPREKYVYHPTPRQRAINQGRKLLERYNCSGCHVLSPEQWELAFASGEFGEQNSTPAYPFVRGSFAPEQVEASSQTDIHSLLRATIVGMPTLNDDAVPRVFDDEGDEITEGDTFNPRTVTYQFDLWAPTLLEGNVYQVGELPMKIRADQVTARRPVWGGDLARYLIGPAVEREKEINPNQKGGEAWGWLPPPLYGEGHKVQTDWLHDYLLDPYPIRPAAVLRMPKFNMSPDEATGLANYFAARDDAEYPYAFGDDRQASRLKAEDQAYRGEGGEDGQRLRDAMKIVTSGNYCVKCHYVADAPPSAAPRAQAPNLADVYRRLRPDYLRRWIAKPNSILPYTAMPVNVPYDDTKPQLGTNVPQDLFHGTSVDQLDGLVDLLMNYDYYTKQETKIAPLVQQAAPATTPEPAAAAAETPAAPAADAAGG